MEPIYILLMTFVTAQDVSSLALRNDSLVEHATFSTLGNCERALVTYALQAEPTLQVQKNQLGNLESYTFAKEGSKIKVSCLRILLPARNALSLS